MDTDRWDNIERDNMAGLGLRAVTYLAPRQDLLHQARQADRSLRCYQQQNLTKTKLRNKLGVLHGIPILVKDNIDTAVEYGMPTSAGSFALGMCVPGVVTVPSNSYVD